MEPTDPVDELFITLADVNRRRILAALLERDPIEFGGFHLLDDIYANERELEHLRIRMYHHHLPKLEEAGFVLWEKETATIAKGPRFEDVRPLLELFEEHADELPWDWS